MSSEWKKFTVEQLVSDGVLAPPLDGNHGAIHPKTADFVPAGIPFIMASDMRNGEVDTQNCAFISPNQAKTLRKGFARFGDVLLSHKATIGRTALVGKTAYDYIVLTPQVTYYRILDPTRLNNRYLKYYFDSIPFQQVLSSWSGAGSTRAYIGITAQRKLPIVLPPIEIQESIAAMVGALDHRIALLRETNKTLESIAQAIFKSWFVDFDPVRAKREGRQPEGMDEATVALFPDSFEESELGLIPSGWTVKAVGDVITALGGATPNTKTDAFWTPEEFHWTTPKDLSGAQSPVLIDTERRISAEGLARVSSGLLPVGTLLMSSRAPIGYLAISRIPVAINQGYIAMPPGGELPPLFMYFWCKINMDTIKGHANGSTFMEISKKAFRPIPIVLPSTEILDGFTQIAESLFDKISVNTEQADALSSLRDTLLPRIISGQLRLPENDILVGEAAV